jgi:hypothetical protein
MFHMLMFVTTSLTEYGNRLVNMQKVINTIKSIYKKYNSNILREGNRIQYFKYKVL